MPNGPVATRHDRAWLVLFASLFSSAGAVLYLRSSMRHAQRLMQANGEIMTLAQRDSLTGLFNRREFNERLAPCSPMAGAAARRLRSSTSISTTSRT